LGDAIAEELTLPFDRIYARSHVAKATIIQRSIYSDTVAAKVSARGIGEVVGAIFTISSKLLLKLTILGTSGFCH
jgi:hypothetical protein